MAAPDAMSIQAVVAGIQLPGNLWLSEIFKKLTLIRQKVKMPGYLYLFLAGLQLSEICCRCPDIMIKGARTNQ